MVFKVLFFEKGKKMVVANSLPNKEIKKILKLQQERYSFFMSFKFYFLVCKKKAGFDFDDELSNRRRQIR